VVKGFIVQAQEGLNGIAESCIQVENDYWNTKRLLVQWLRHSMQLQKHVLAKS
jgi:hypothetical protein